MAELPRLGIRRPARLAIYRSGVFFIGGLLLPILGRGSLGRGSWAQPLLDRLLLGAEAFNEFFLGRAFFDRILGGQALSSGLEGASSSTGFWAPKLLSRLFWRVAL